MNISTFNEWLVAFRTHDISKMVSLLTDDARINSIIFGTYIGKDGATEYWQLLYNVFPDIKINPVTITADENGNRIVAEIDISGRLAVPQGPVKSLVYVGRLYMIS